jgi:hypothetical protein
MVNFPVRFGLLKSIPPLFYGKSWRTERARTEGTSMITCDLCGEAKNCLEKEVDGKEYDICCECWNPLAQKLKGKGRAINREIVLLPPREVKEQEDDEKPLPGEPPKICGAVKSLAF